MEIGWIAIVGLAGALLGTLLQRPIMVKWRKYRMAKLKYTNQRIKYISTYLECIHILKYNAWEDFAFRNIQRTRVNEVRYIFYTQIMRALTDLIFSVIPIIISASTIGIYVATGGELTVAKVYTIIVLYSMLSVYIYIYIYIVTLGAIIHSDANICKNKTKCK